MYELIEGRLDEFFEVPFRIYPSTSPYVSPMKSDLERFLSTKNPLFREADSFAFYTVRHGGAPIGRIVAHVHRASNARYGTRRSYFGYFDCADDPEAARVLLDAAEGWGRSRGFTEIAGGFNLTAMQQSGIVTDGFQGVPYTDMQYNPPYIPDLLARMGYERFFPMSTFEFDIPPIDTNAMLGDKERACLTSPELRWVPLTMGNFKSHLPALTQILNESFDKNPMFVPLTLEEFAFQAQEMMWIVDNRIACMVYDRDEPAGSFIWIPDVNPLVRATKARYSLATPFHFLRYRMNRRRALVVFTGVRPQYQKRGLSSALLYRTVKAMQDAGYRQAGTTWIADENTASLRLTQKVGAHRLHRLHLFKKSLA
jgi:GNAT superfamily N-acetyltransferase